MFVRYLMLLVTAALSAVSSLHAQDFDAFRRAAQAYELRMMKDVGGVVITGRRSTTNEYGVLIEATFTDMIKGAKWRRETRALIPRTPGDFYDKGSVEKSTRTHPAPPADGDNSYGAEPDTAKKSPPPVKEKAKPAPSAAATTAKTAPQTAPAPSTATNPARPGATAPVPVPATKAVQPVKRVPAVKKIEPVPSVPAVTATAPTKPAVTAQSGEIERPASAPVSGSATARPAVPLADSVITVYVFDGRSLWQEVNGRVSLVRDPEEQGIFPPAVPGHDYWRDCGRDTIAQVGSESKNTRNCWVLESDSVRLWVDKEDYFLVASEEKDPFDSEPVRLNCSAFFRVGNGYTVPGHIDRFRNNVLVESENIATVSFEWNLPDNLFVVQQDQPERNPASTREAPDEKRDGRRKR